MPSGYGQYCPISRALEVLGERWSLLIVRDLLVGTTRFNDLARGLPGLSRSLLSRRLRQLEAAGIVERLDGDYLLTEAGRELRPIVFGLGEWGARWAFADPEPSELDPELLMWWAHTRLDTSLLPDRRVVIAVTFSDDRRRFWLVAEPATATGGDRPVSVCLTDPGYEVDVAITSDVASAHKVWLGTLELRAAMRSGRLVFSGDPALTRRMPQVLQLSPVAEIVRSATAGG